MTGCACPTSERAAAGTALRAFAHPTFRCSSAALALVLRVGHVLHPLDVLAVERLLQGDVSHRCGRARAVPVLLARRDPHRVAGADFVDGAAPGLGATRAPYHV